MKEPIYIRQAQTENVNGEKIQLYYFAKENTDGVEGSYAIGIDMYTQLSDGRTIKESKSIDYIFSLKGEAQRFTDMLCSGVVTPSTLDDIVSDYAI